MTVQADELTIENATFNDCKMATVSLRGIGESEKSFSGRLVHDSALTAVDLTKRQPRS